MTVLSFNDFHGRINASAPSTVAFAETIQNLRAAHPGAALTSAGDNVGASLFASSFREDQPTIDVLNALGLQASAVGNHEFDRGVSDLQTRIVPAAKWDYLAANVTVDGKPMPAFKVLDVNGVKVGFIGAVTQETPSLVSPSGLQGVQFSDPVDAVNRVAKELKDGDPSNGEADVLVASYHEGAASQIDLPSAKSGSAVFKKIVEQTDDSVSAIFNAHTHMVYSWEAPKPGGGTRPVVQAGSYASHVANVTFSVDPATKQVSKISSALTPVPKDPVGSTDPVVTDVKKITDDTLAAAKVVGEEPVGAVTADITTAMLNGKRDDRLSESALSNLVAGYMVEAVKDRGGAEIAFMNPGGLRSDLANDPAYKSGDKNITKAEANAVLPFANTLMTMTMTGDQIKKVLEQQWQPVDASRPFLALGTSKGFSWTFDPTLPVGDRITSITFDGKPLEMAASYKVATQSFLASGGDNFFEFANAADKKDTGLVDSDTWQEYLGKHVPLTPDFARHAVAAKDLPSTLKPGEKVSFTLADLNLTSAGAPLASSAKVALGKVSLSDAKVDVSKDIDTTTFGAQAFPSALDGSAKIEFTVPDNAVEGANQITVELDNGTTVYVPVTVSGGVAGPTGSLDGLLGEGLGSLGGPDSSLGAESPQGPGDAVLLLGSLGLIVGGGLVAAQLALANRMLPPEALAALPQPVKDFLHI